MKLITGIKIICAGGALALLGAAGPGQAHAHGAGGDVVSHPGGPAPGRPEARAGVPQDQPEAGCEAQQLRTVLASFFPRSERVTFRKFALDAAARERLRRRLGYLPARATYTVFVASTGPQVDGYAVIDDEKGEHQPITLATQLSPRGVVERVEIVTYREPRGDEVRDARFRAQFRGKTARDPMALGRDIDAVSGATISSGSLAVAVRRAAVLVEELVLPSGSLILAARH